MTAEIAILNKQGVALAADSAVTLGLQGGSKIFTSANKLFALSKYHPVAVMVYGNATLMGIPWETVIKVYRACLATRECSRLEDYAQDFVNFLGKDPRLFSADLQLSNLRNHVTDYMRIVRDDALEQAKQAIAQRGTLTQEEVSDIILSTIEKHYAVWQNCPLPKETSPERINSIQASHAGLFRETIAAVFERLEVTDSAWEKLLGLSASLFVKFPREVHNSAHSGVVFAGFGRDDMYPAVQSFVVEAVVDNCPKYKELEDRSFRISDQLGGAIVPFAQDDVVHTFMEGVEPGYEQTIERFMLEILQQFPGVVIDSIAALTDIQKDTAKSEWTRLKSKEIFEQYRQRLQQYRIEKHVSNIMNIVQLLPKDELAAIAEALVNLTSFKRRVSMDMETVGGPIDVAVISKGDGLVWIKRKHYFRPELNPQFFANNYQEVPR